MIHLKGKYFQIIMITEIIICRFLGPSSSTLIYIFMDQMCLWNITYPPNLDLVLEEYRYWTRLRLIAKLGSISLSWSNLVIHREAVYETSTLNLSFL